MEDIATDDDLLSDMLLDSLEFEPKIATHKMNQAYRSPRYKTQQIIDLVRQKIVIDGDLNGALEALCNVDVIKKHMAGKSIRQRHEFQVHARRYLETYMPESGVEFALTTRYKRASRLQAGVPESSKAAQEQAEAEARAMAANSAVGRGKMRAENGEQLGTSMADLCVVATRQFKAGELIMLCKGGVKDLTKSEDEALREEAALSRERRKEQQYAGVLGPGRDFSVIRSARKGCSQLLLGPARFVNHDCEPNCEFHRLGQSHMVFRCLQDIGLNEEITTYYGDNYFEVGNSECMCHTCEVRCNGAFAVAADAPMQTAPAVPASENPVKGRRSSSRKGKSPPPSIKPEPVTIRIERNGKVIEKTFNHHVSSREFDDHAKAGPRCTCLTCGSTFWAPEAWWLPDECRRCERHFKIYQGDWPGRVPTEPKWSAIYQDRKAKRESVDADLRRRRLLDIASPGLSGASDVETPVKLSPLRETEEGTTTTNKRRRTQNGDIRKKKRSRNGGSDSGVEESIRSAKKQPRGTSLSSDENDNDDDISELTSVSANDVAMSRSASSSVSHDSFGSDDRPSGPRMLGKQAKTETLAMFWGAPEGDKRARKTRPNGLESLSGTVKTHKHRRTASDMSGASFTALRERESYRSPSGPQPRTTPILSSTVKLEQSQSPVSNEAKALTPPLATGAPLLKSFPSSAPASSASHALATQGPERTSVKNLAMAWGAGVEDGGRGSRRRTPREVGTPSSLVSSSPKHGKDEGSCTPPIKKQRTASPERRPSVSEPVSAPHAGPVYPAPSTAEPVVPAIAPVTPSSMQCVPSAPSPPSERSISPALSTTGSPAARNASPLAGAPPVTFAARPGVTPGQPIRRNLRWGSGKVSISRPLTGQTGSPLAGPAALSPGRSQPLSTPQPVVLRNNGSGPIGASHQDAGLRSTSDSVLTGLKTHAVKADVDEGSAMRARIQNGTGHVKTEEDDV